MSTPAIIRASSREPLLTLERVHAAGGDVPVAGLADHEVPVGVGSDLRQVGHDDDLGVLGERGQPGADVEGGRCPRPRRRPRRRRTWARRRAAGCRVTTSSASMTRDSSPPEAALATVRAGAAGVGGEQDLDVVAAVPGQAGAPSRVTATSTVACPIARCGELAGHGAAQPLGRRAAAPW